jgi:glycosyltransferase involved in cell wall biosynthesis
VKHLSVIIPTYQHARTISACLETVLAQTLPADEIIVVNDGSTDNTVGVLKPYEGRIALITQPNMGGNAARNRGFEASSGERVLFCDADVILHRNALETMSRTLDEHPAASFAYSAFRFGWKKFAGFAYDANRLKQMNYIHTTSLIRREHFPGFDPAIRRFQDWDLWLTMLEQGYQGVHIPKVLFHVIDDHGRRAISQWRPSILYHIPWKRLRWIPPSVEKYEAAKRVIVEKHHL